MVICLERDADLHMAQLMPRPLTVSCLSKIQIGFTFLAPAYPGSPGKRAVKRVCVCVTVTVISYLNLSSTRSFYSRYVLDEVHFFLVADADQISLHFVATHTSCLLIRLIFRHVETAEFILMPAAGTCHCMTHWTQRAN